MSKHRAHAWNQFAVAQLSLKGKASHFHMDSSPFTALVGPGFQERGLCPCLTRQHDSASTSLLLYFLCTTLSMLVRGFQQRRVKEGQVSSEAETKAAS